MNFTSTDADNAYILFHDHVGKPECTDHSFHEIIISIIQSEEDGFISVRPSEKTCVYFSLIGSEYIAWHWVANRRWNILLSTLEQPYRIAVLTADYNYQSLAFCHYSDLSDYDIVFLRLFLS